MLRRATKTALGLLLVAASACTRAGAPAPAYSMSGASVLSSSPSSAYDPGALPAPTLQPAEPDLFSVAPDRVLLPVTLEAEGTGYAAAASALRSAIVQLGAELNEHGSCTSRLIDYVPPHPRGSKSKSGDPGEIWSAIAQLEVNVPLEGLTDVAARMGQVDVCLGHLASLRAQPEGALAGSRIQPGAPLVTIDDPGKYRESLIATRLARLRALAEQSPGAPQYHPTDLRCASLGQVTIVSRSLDAVKLSVDMACTTPSRAETNAAP